VKGCSLLCRNIGIVYAYTLHTLIVNIFLLLSPELWAAIGDVSKMHSMKMERKWPFTETRQTLLLPAAQANIISAKACYGRTLERVWWESLFSLMSLFLLRIPFRRHSPFTCPIPLPSSGLGPFLRLSLFLMKLGSLWSIGEVFYRMPPNLGF